MSEQAYEPLSAEEMQQLAEIDSARVNLGLRILELESEKIAILAQAKKLDMSWSAVMKKVTDDRNIPEGTPFSIDPETGSLNLSLEGS